MSERPRLVEAVEAAPEPIDPSAVPLYPLLRVEIRQLESGVFEGVVDDAVVAADVDLEPVRRAVIGGAALMAGKRVGAMRAIRVRGTAPDGAVFNLVVTASGDVLEVPSPSGDTGGKATRTKPGRPLPGNRGNRGTGVLFVGGLLLVAALLIGTPIALTIAQLRDGDDKAETPALPTPVQLPVVAPAPYDDVAAWSIKLGAASFATDSGVVDADQERVYVTRDGGKNLVAFDSGTGAFGWEFGDLGSPVADGPALTVVDGEPVLALASSTRLVLLDPETGTKEGEWDLPAVHRGVRMTATGPVVLAADTKAQILVEGELEARVIPATGVPVAPTPDGSLVVVGGNGQVWTVKNDRLAGPSKKLPRVRRHEMTRAVGWTGSQMILSYTSRKQTGFGVVRLVAVDTRDWERQWRTRDVPVLWTGTPEKFDLQAAPAGEWGIYGTEAIDLTTGKTTRLASDWKTTAVGDTQAFGTGEGRPLVATPAGVTRESIEVPPLSSLTHLTAPQATAGEDRVFLIINTAAESVLYALRRDGTTSPSPTTPTTPED